MRFLRRGDSASSLDLLVVGLGNPGREYAAHRHNAGFMVVEELARRAGASFRSKFNGQLADARLDGARVVLLKPETYMNESGRAVGAAAGFYKVDPDSVLVVHDEGDLDLGRLQLRAGGGLAGHNGLRSIASHLKTQDFLRLRIGVGRPGPRRPARPRRLRPVRLRAGGRRRGARRPCRGRGGVAAARRARGEPAAVQLAPFGGGRRIATLSARSRA